MSTSISYLYVCARSVRQYIRNSTQLFTEQQQRRQELRRTQQRAHAAGTCRAHSRFAHAAPASSFAVQLEGTRHGFGTPEQLENENENECSSAADSDAEPAVCLRPAPRPSGAAHDILKGAAALTRGGQSSAVSPPLATLALSSTSLEARRAHQQHSRVSSNSSLVSAQQQLRVSLPVGSPPAAQSATNPRLLMLNASIGSLRQTPPRAPPALAPAQSLSPLATSSSASRVARGGLRPASVSDPPDPALLLASRSQLPPAHSPLRPQANPISRQSSATAAQTSTSASLAKREAVY